MRQDDAKIGQKVQVNGPCIHGPSCHMFTGREGIIENDAYDGYNGPCAQVKMEGMRVLVAYKYLEPVVEMKTGDRVKVLRAWKEGEFSHGLCMSISGQMAKYIGEIGKVDGHGWFDKTWRVEFPDGETWAYPEQVLQKVNTKPHIACILTEKVVVGDVKCRKITGFEGILTEEELPKRYTNGEPAFWFVPMHGGAHIFRNGKMTWGNSFESKYASNPGISCSFPDNDIDVGGFIFHGLHVGDIWPETTFQNILVWLKRAGSRLAKIKRQEHDAWAGKENVEI